MRPLLGHVPDAPVAVEETGSATGWTALPEGGMDRRVTPQSVDELVAEQVTR